MHAFDMSNYTRVIATDGRISGSFVVQGSSKGIFAIDPLDVTIYDETRSWGRVFRHGDFDVQITDGVPSVGKDVNPDKAADLDAARELMDATLAVVAQAYDAGLGSNIEQELANAGESDTSTFALSKETK